MDPTSIGASVLTIIGATYTVVKSLCDTIGRYNARNRTLQDLNAELESIIKILDSLLGFDDIDQPLWQLLEGPIQRCREVCSAFETAMEAFGSKPHAGLLDWAKMEFRKASINDFKDSISGYKSTITVAIGIITLQTNQASHKFLKDYMEMAEATAYELKIRLQRIDERMSQLSNEKALAQDACVDLHDERAVTEKCLQICEDAKELIESLASRESSVLQPEVPNNTEDVVQEAFEAQLATRKAFDDLRETLTATIKGHVERLGQDSDFEERKQLHHELKASLKCLEVCNMGAKISHQKICRIGEASAAGNSDHVVINSFSDLFDVGKTKSSDHSALFIGSLRPGEVQGVMAKRYDSRFGANVKGATPAAGAGADRPPRTTQSQRPNHTVYTARDEDETQALRTRRQKPAPNEPRKRFPDGNWQE